MTNYSVGDVIGFARFHSFGSILIHGFGTVTKINGHGHVFVETKNGEKRFDKYGNSYKDNYGPSLIGAARLTEIIENNENKRNISRASKEMTDLISSVRSGNGDFHITNEMLDELQTKIDKLREMI